MAGAGSAHRKLVCDQSLPLPGDIIEGFAKDDADDMFVPVKAKSDLSSQLGKLNNQQVEVIWVKVRSWGDRAMKLQARIVQEKFSMAQPLHRRYTIRAVGDDRHVAVLGDLTLEQCTDLSQSVVNMDCWEFNKRGVKYDWKMKVGTYLPDQRSPVVRSILFMRLQYEYCIEATTARCMAWFSGAISSGIPLVFVNIETEQILTSDKTGREISWGRQQNAASSQIVQGTRLWLLPGAEEVPLEMIPRPGEEWFGINIKRTDEGFIYVYAITRGLAADRSGLRHLHEEAIANGYLLVISQLEGKSLMPTSGCSDGLILCCDHNEIRDTLSSAILEMDRIQLHVMSWPNQARLCNIQPILSAATFRPPRGCIDDFCPETC
ncbi:hypothetical protein I3760_15G084000 [Carya illinoinensis]|nr:hypothetical protein I3760_15G084000 [Carya illinoinensis]